MVIKYCTYHVEASKKNADDKPNKTDEEVKTWDTDFIKTDQATLFEIILVSWFLGVCLLPCFHPAGRKYTAELVFSKCGSHRASMSRQQTT